MATSMAKGACRSPSAEHPAETSAPALSAAAQVLEEARGLREMGLDVLA